MDIIDSYVYMCADCIKKGRHVRKKEKTESFLLLRNQHLHNQNRPDLIMRKKKKEKKRYEYAPSHNIKENPSIHFCRMRASLRWHSLNVGTISTKESNPMRMFWRRFCSEAMWLAFFSASVSSSCGAFFDLDCCVWFEGGERVLDAWLSPEDDCLCRMPSLSLMCPEA
jgi:hypothetical protein